MSLEQLKAMGPLPRVDIHVGFKSKTVTLILMLGEDTTEVPIPLEVLIPPKYGVCDLETVGDVAAHVAFKLGLIQEGAVVFCVNDDAVDVCKN